LPQPSLEDRVRRLEGYRYKAVGEINAQRTLLVTALATLIRRSSFPAAQELKILRETWLPSSPQAPKIFPGIDPSEIGAFQQEYEASIEGLLAELQVALGLPK
jgi:hypothetical protein